MKFRRGKRLELKMNLLSDHVCFTTRKHDIDDGKIHLRVLFIMPDYLKRGFTVKADAKPYIAKKYQQRIVYKPTRYRKIE